MPDAREQTSEQQSYATALTRFALQVQSQHPLLTLVSNEEGQLPATQSAPAPSRAGHAMGQYFPMRLSPSGARSLLFASFWAALLQAPLGCAVLPCWSTLLPFTRICSSMCLPLALKTACQVVASHLSGRVIPAAVGWDLPIPLRALWALLRWC